MNPFRWFRAQDDLIDTLIKSPRYTFTGHDEDLEQRTRARRDQAAALVADARKIETRDDRLTRVRKWA